MKTTVLRAAILALATGSGFAMPVTPAEARPSYCVQQAWYYADDKAGRDRSTEEWSYYNALFQDYNQCNTPWACNDFDRPCMDPE